MQEYNIEIKVIPRAKKNFIKNEDGVLKIYVTAPAQDGRANDAALNVLADYLGVKKSNLYIKKGEKSRNKIIEVLQ